MANTYRPISRMRSERSPNNPACMVGSGMAKAYALMRPTRFYRTVVCIYIHHHHQPISYCIGVHRICTSPGAHTSSVAYRSNHAAESYIPVAPICLCTHQCCWLYRHRNYPCSTTHGRRSLDRTHPARTRMPAGTTGLSRLANPITKPRPVVASEDTHASCHITHTQSLHPHHIWSLQHHHIWSLYMHHMPPLCSLMYLYASL